MGNAGRLLVGMAAWSVFLVLPARPLTAASIPFFQPNPNGLTAFGGATRETHVQALNDVTLTELGVRLDPVTVNAQLEWKVVESDVLKIPGTILYDTGTIGITDLGLQDYDTPVSVALTGGDYYILSLKVVSGTVDMVRFDESGQGLPFTTTDSSFLITDGGSNVLFFGAGGFDVQNFLPAFSVSTVLAPPALAAGAVGLALLGAWRRRRSP